MNRDTAEMFKTAITNNDSNLLQLVLSADQLSYNDMCELVKEMLVEDKTFGGKTIGCFNIKLHDITPVNKKNYQPFAKLLRINNYKVITVRQILTTNWASTSNSNYLGREYTIRNKDGNIKPIISSKPIIFLLYILLTSLGVETTYEQLKSHVLYEGNTRPE